MQKTAGSIPPRAVKLVHVLPGSADVTMRGILLVALVVALAARAGRRLDLDLHTLKGGRKDSVCPALLGEIDGVLAALPRELVVR